ncbi:MAG: helix-turn-helix domain-containing protein [Clostridiales bacterium]
MTNKELERLFKALCSAFPQSDIMILSKARDVIFSRFVLRVLTAELFSVKKAASFFKSGDRQYILISLLLPGGFYLLLSLPAENYESEESPLAMVYSLEQAVFLADKQATPKMIKDKYSLFVKQLLRGPATEEASFISMLASEAGIDLTLPRVVCLIDFEEIPGKEYQKQELLAAAATLVRSFRLAHAGDIVGISENSQLLLCRRLTKKAFSAKAQCNEYFLQLQSYLTSGLGCQVFVGVGFTVSSIPEYAHSYTCAQLALQRSRRGPEGLSYAIDHLIEIIFEHTPLELLKHFFHEDVQEITANPLFFQTLEALLLHHMNMAEAANSLYIHRNTLIFRTKQIKNLLELDPVHSDNDRYTLHLIYNYYKWQAQLFADKKQV